jgi:hypothetical protein
MCRFPTGMLGTSPIGAAIVWATAKYPYKVYKRYTLINLFGRPQRTTIWNKPKFN